LQALLIRHGRTDYLLRVPAAYVRVEDPMRVQIIDGLDLDAVERAAIESGRTPPTGEHIVEAGPTQPSATAEQVVGGTMGLPRSYDGPATG
jgi:hypothetical protein